MAAADDGTDWSLVNFARQVFGAKSAAPQVGFNFVEPEPQKADPEPPKVEPEPSKPEPAKPEPARPETAAAPAAAEPAAEAEDPPAPEEDAVGQPAEAAADQQAITHDEPSAAALPEIPEAPASEPVLAASESPRQRRTASEMADIIMNALRAVDGVPERGFVITVYGSRPWNAMLTIKPEAGRIKDAQLWRQRVQDIGARLRRDFDLIDESDS